MISALYISKTGLSAQDTQLTTIANNLANASTVGFKRDRVVFEDLMYQIHRQPGAQSSENTLLASGLQIGTGVRVVGTQKQFTEGSLQITEQPLDVAINGRGFFEMEMPDGSVAYTRNGQFHLDDTGQIVNAQGMVLQPGLTVPPGTQNVTIGDDGVVSSTIRDAQGTSTQTQIGNITLADFTNPAGLQGIGSSLFIETVASGTATQGTPGLSGLGSVQQGALENSNVNVVEELVNMITTQRAYEMNSKVVSTADQMMNSINQNL